MAFFKVAACMLLMASAGLARPQEDVLLSSAEEASQYFNPNPQYTYQYQVAAEEQQTYIAHQESRDGTEVSGEYSYVDPTGTLITVTYTAGVDGYQETRSAQPNFVTIRARPVVRPVVQEASSSDSDLVGNIINQLTPFIKGSVSSSLGSDSSAAAAPAVRRTIVAAAPAQPVARVAAADGSTSAIFGDSPKSVAVESPNFAFAFDLGDE